MRKQFVIFFSLILFTLLLFHFFLGSFFSHSMFTISSHQLLSLLIRISKKRNGEKNAISQLVSVYDGIIYTASLNWRRHTHTLRSIHNCVMRKNERRRKCDMWILTERDDRRYIKESTSIVKSRSFCSFNSCSRHKAVLKVNWIKLLVFKEKIHGLRNASTAAYALTPQNKSGD